MQINCGSHYFVYLVNNADYFTAEKKNDATLNIAIAA